MNKLNAKLIKIEGMNVKLLTFEVDDGIIKVLSLDEYIKNKEYFLEVNPSKLFLSKEKFEYENRLEVEIEEIAEMDILVNVFCKYKNYKFEVLMLKEFVNFENKAYLYFRASDVFIEEKDD